MLKSEIFTITKLSELEFLEYQNNLESITIPLEQSPAWGAFNEAVAGRKNLGSFKYEENGRLVALATAILYSERGRSWIWIKHGPVFIEQVDTEIIKKMCATLKAQFNTLKNEGGSPLFVRVSMPHSVSGLVLPFEHTMYDETIVIDLTMSEDEILASMSKSGRQGIRTAAKAGVVVKEVTHNPSGYFAKHCYPILKETGTRDSFGIHPLSTYTTMLDTLKNESRLYVALHEGLVEAWMITTEYRGQALYYYAASSAKARETFAAYALQWEVIKIMKSRGNKTYDLMGIAGKNFPSLENVTRFKTKFSKNIVSIPFTYDLPLQPLRYRLFSLLIKLKRVTKH
jgi:lipid II:glycine glycyltransferase (peptidoglycan interpeptide bridge formation enzyme)